MISIWNWLKGKEGYAYGLIFSIFALVNFLDEDGAPVWGIADLIVGAFFVYAFQFGFWKRGKPKAEPVATDLRTKRGPLELSKGLEPVPIPGERYTFDDPHELGSQSATCTYCRNWKEHHSE